MTANLATGANDQGDTYADIASLSGSPGADTLTGNAAANTLAGGGGADLLIGAGGADNLVGNTAATPGDGAVDAASYADGRAAGVIVDLAAGTNTDGDTFAGIDRLLGSPFDDELTGGPGPDDFDGGGGADTLLGAAGADTLRGGPSNDLVSGGAGTDNLFGDDGSDDLRAVDGEVDSVDCGAGAADEARVDSIDTRVGCETEDVTGPATGPPPPTPPPPPPIAPVESIPTITPPPAPAVKPVRAAARITARVSRSRLTRLVVTNVIAGASVRVSCSAKARGVCPYKSKTTRVARAAAQLSLVKPFASKRLKPGTTLTVAVSVRGQIGAWLTLKTVKGKAPRTTRGCLAPGTRVKVGCP